MVTMMRIDKWLRILSSLVVLSVILVISISATERGRISLFIRNKPEVKIAESAKLWITPERAQVSKGLVLPWDEAKKYFPRYSVAVLTDVETGKRFSVVRRGGTYHGDIQTLTADDTAILKEIYGGSWSWRRRAAIAEVGMKRIAASINGMPHGFGKIRGNDMVGHFCIHFYQSKVHKSGKVDPAHQMMIWKAAGQPDFPFIQAEPQEVIDLVITAINQQDIGLAALGLDGQGGDFWLVEQAFKGVLPTVAIEGLKLIKEKDTPSEKEFQVRVSLYHPGDRNKTKKEGILLLKRIPSTGRWFLQGAGLKDILTE